MSRTTRRHESDARHARRGPNTKPRIKGAIRKPVKQTRPNERAQLRKEYLR
jgi:hypothetical protein